MVIFLVRHPMVFIFLKLFDLLECPVMLWNFSVGVSVNPHVCFILDLILISMFLR